MRRTTMALFMSLCWLQSAAACIEHDSTTTGWVNQQSPRSWEMVQSTHSLDRVSAIPVGLTITALALVGVLGVMIRQRRTKSSRLRAPQLVPPVVASFLRNASTVPPGPVFADQPADSPWQPEQEVIDTEDECDSVTSDDEIDCVRTCYASP